MVCRSVVVVILALWSGVAGAQVVDPAYSADPIGEPAVRSVRLVEISSIDPDVVLPSSVAVAADDIQSLQAWNESGNVPQRAGFSRQLPRELRFGSPVVALRSGGAHSYVTRTDDGHMSSFVARVEVAGAYAVRFVLEDVNLPADAELMVVGADGDAQLIDHKRLVHDGTIWTPMVAGPSAAVMLGVPGVKESTADYFVIRRVLEILPTRLWNSDRNSDLDSDAAACLKDAACSKAEIDPTNWGRAVGFMVFEKAGDVYICSGGLLNDSVEDGFVPYFLTANHCLSSQSSASSLQVLWDYVSSSCGAPAPDLLSLKKSSGADLLYTSSAIDASFLRLYSAPAGRLFMGWDPRTASLVEGLELHRFSHPDGLPLSYSRTALATVGGTCSEIPRPYYIYSAKRYGAISGGASGSQVFYGDGYVVGQLYGNCGHNTEDECDTSNEDVDGSFAYLYPSIKSYLRPETTTCSACVPSATTACAMDGRFKIEVRWRSQFASPPTDGLGKVITYAENAKESHPTYGTMSENIFFSMFPHAPKRVELVVKLFRGVGINDHFWVTAAGLTNNEYWVKVTDTQTCRTWERANPHNQFNVLVDQRAFPLN